MRNPTTFKCKLSSPFSSQPLGCSEFSVTLDFNLLLELVFHIRYVERLCKASLLPDFYMSFPCNGTGMLQNPVYRQQLQDML